MTDQTTIDILLDVYAYHHSFTIAKTQPDFPPDKLFLLELLKERRELNVDFLFANRAKIQRLEEKYGIVLICNPYEEELLANYILDLETKVRNDTIIDFVRSVSPILYRLFMRLLISQIPDLLDYIHDTKNDQYDTWKFDRMHQSENSFVQQFVSQKRDSRLTSRSLVEFILLTDLSDEIKATVQSLRQFEKNVRNPLAHLIKAFDEEELYRTTGFSSQVFLEQIINLARMTGVVYDVYTFYFDQVNAILKAN